MTLEQYDIRYHELPLAVYREIAAHLGQIEGVETELLPQEATEFDYMQSQVGWLRMGHPNSLGEADRDQLKQILDFYAERFGPWSRRSENGPAS
ncbi:MAG: hypothetical protein ACFCU8_09150 [Thermosynechococcaceae cyanobacterium]